MTFKIRAPIHGGNRLQALIIGMLLVFFGYMIPNHYHLYDPKYLELSAADKFMVHTPWTVWIYLSEYFYFFAAYYLMRENITMNRLLWSFMFVQIVSMIFFVFYPTTFPRHDYPILPSNPESIRMAFKFLHTIDTPCNSFPSLHVSACFVTVYSFWDESKPKFWFFAVWATLIALSTMTTKQHYFVDAVAGFALASLAGWIFVFKAQYQGLGAQSDP